MVRLKFKKENEGLFIMDTTLDKEVKVIIDYIVKVQNGRLKIERLCYGENEQVYLSLFPANYGLLLEVLTHQLALPVILLSVNGEVQKFIFFTGKSLKFEFKCGFSRFDWVFGFQV